MPTLNSVLRMHYRERIKLDNFIKNAVSMCIAEESVFAISTESVLKLRLTDLQKLEYLSMTRPNTSKKYLIRKKNARRVKRKRL